MIVTDKKHFSVKNLEQSMTNNFPEYSQNSKSTKDQFLLHMTNI